MSASNARLIEKDIMAAIGPDDHGDSEIIDLSGASKFSCQAVYDVQSPSAKTFASPHLASLVNQSLTYTSVDPGLSSNDITIALVNTGVPSQTLSVATVGSAITVDLALDAGVAALLTNQGITFTANSVGTAGNSITITMTGTPLPPSIVVVGTAIQINLAENGGGDIISTAADVISAVNSDVAAHALITASGSGSDPLTNLSTTPLASGANPAITSTGNDVKALVNADPDASALVLVSGTNASTLVVLAATNLASGSDGAVDVDADTIALDASAMGNGLKVRLTTTGTLPSPFLTATDYFVIKLSDSLVQLATSLVDAEDSIPIDITDAGSDNAVGTMTAVSLSGATVGFYKSNSSAGPWILIQSATTISADGSVLLEQPNVCYRYFKATKALTAGQVDLACDVLVIGPAV